MSDESTVDRTLSRNNIRSFILRIDLLPNENLSMSKIVEKLSHHFERSEKRTVSSFSFNFTTNDSGLSKNEAYDYVLISPSRQMVFSELNQAFWLESSSYQSNKIYKDIINKAIDAITSVSPEVQSRRIGLRYINEFDCKNIKNISKIYSRRLSTIVKQMLSLENQTRVIGMEELSINDDVSIRMQYGVPNKYYPSKIAACDLLLDIDSYTNVSNKIDEWEETIRTLNHSAYDVFTNSLDQQFIENIK